MMKRSEIPLYGIAVAATLAEMPIATLRLYEAKGVLQPSRSGGGTRRYSDDDLTRLARASALRAQGVNMAGIKIILELEDEIARLKGRR
ncbi:MerR family transcriptional regulator [Microbacterium sp. YY-03]|uniref:MerR family transcriptional regulator n=1 Tax=Microbacterium sp. YY-03 TaxID=3421636 RepID=UPI003D174FA7